MGRATCSYLTVLPEWSQARIKSPVSINHWVKTIPCWIPVTVGVATASNLDNFSAHSIYSCANALNVCEGANLSSSSWGSYDPVTLIKATANTSNRSAGKANKSTGNPSGPLVRMISRPDAHQRTACSLKMVSSRTATVLLTWWKNIRKSISWCCLGGNRLT